MDTETFDDLRWYAERSIRYHRHREAFYEGWHKKSMVLIMVSGSSACAALFIVPTDFSWFPKLASFLVAVISMIDVAYSPMSKAIKHSTLAKQFGDLEQRLIGGVSETQFAADRCKIEAEEPPILRTLDVVCHNELVRAWNYSDEELKKLSWFQKMFANYLRNY